MDRITSSNLITTPHDRPCMYICMQPLTFPELEELDSSATSWTDTDIHVDVL